MSSQLHLQTHLVQLAVLRGSLALDSRLTSQSVYGIIAPFDTLLIGHDGNEYA
jgi:hypothetical protein